MLLKRRLTDVHGEHGRARGCEPLMTAGTAVDERQQDLWTVSTTAAITTTHPIM